MCSSVRTDHTRCNCLLWHEKLMHIHVIMFVHTFFDTLFYQPVNYAQQQLDFNPCPLQLSSICDHLFYWTCSVWQQWRRTNWRNRWVTRWGCHCRGRRAVLGIARVGSFEWCMQRRLLGIKYCEKTRACIDSCYSWNISSIFHSIFHVQICPSQQASLPKKHIVWQMMVSVSDGSTCSVIPVLVSGVSSINGISTVLFPWNLTWNLKIIPRQGDSFWTPSWTGSMLSFGGVHLPFFRLQIFPHPMTFRFGVTYCATIPANPLIETKRFVY